MFFITLGISKNFMHKNHVILSKNTALELQRQLFPASYRSLIYVVRQLFGNFPDFDTFHATDFNTFSFETH